MRRFDFNPNVPAVAGLCEAGGGSAPSTCGVTDPTCNTTVGGFERPSPWYAPLLTPALSSRADRENQASRRITLLASLALAVLPCQTAFAEEPSDPAAHTVIVPYDPGKPLEGQKAERYFLPYDDFQRLWELAKENRRPALEVDDPIIASIQSALYRGRIVERGLEIEARLSVVSRGEWASQPLPFQLKDAPEGLRIGSITVDGQPAALVEGGLRFEKPGRHEVTLTLRCVTGTDWRTLSLDLPPSLATSVSIDAPATDGWLRVNGDWATGGTESAGRRIFTHSLGGWKGLTLERSARGIDRGEGAVPSATVTHLLRVPELGPEQWESGLLFSFPGAHRRSLAFTLDSGLQLRDLRVETESDGPRDFEIARISEQPAAGGHRRIQLELRQEIQNAARVLLKTSRTVDPASSQRRSPVIRPEAERIASTMEILHDTTHEIIPETGAGVRRIQAPAKTAVPEGWTHGGSFEVQNADGLLAYETRPAETRGEVTTDYVFQLSEQKCELLAAVSVSMKSGVTGSLRLTLPDDYEVQSVTSPLIKRWQEEAGTLHVHLDTAATGAEARLAVHLARTADQPASQWTLAPLVVEGFEKVRGTVLIAAHAATEVRLPGFTRTATLDETDPSVLDTTFAIAPPVERKRALSYEQTDWTVTASLARQEPRFLADGVLLVSVSDAGIRLSQHITADVERGAIRALRLQLPASLPEARVTGDLLREMRSTVNDEVREYECTFQADVLDETHLVLDFDLPLGTRLDAPFIAVPDAQALTRFIVLDNGSSRESRVTNPESIEKVTREALPFLPKNLSRPEFFRGTTDGPLSIAFSELNQTEGNAAIVTLAEIVTVLRSDGERWDTVKYSLLNRSLQFLPVLLPSNAELMAARVSGEVVRVDEESRSGRVVKLVPLIHTRPGERGLNVELIYRMPSTDAGVPDTLTLDDPELDGLSVEHTTWSVWTPEGWRVTGTDGNMTEATDASKSLLQKVAAVSMIKAATQRMLSGELAYDDAQAALRSAEKWITELNSEVSVSDRDARSDSESLDKAQSLEKELTQQSDILTHNRKKILDTSRERTQKLQQQLSESQQETAWFDNGAPAMSHPFGNVAELGDLNVNSFTQEWVQKEGAQVLNDNIAVANGFLYKGVPKIELGKKLQGGGFDGMIPAPQAPPDSIDGVPGQADWNSLAQNAFNSNARGNNLNQIQLNIEAQRELQRKEAEQLRREQEPMDMPFGGAPAAAADPFAAAPPQLERRAGRSSSAPASPKPDMTDPFGSPPPPPVAASAVHQASGPAKAKSSQEEVDFQTPQLLVQSVESLRPTGRRSLDLDVPQNGRVLHFTKLKDHALIELDLKPDRSSAQRGGWWVFLFAGGLWGLLQWRGRKATA